MKKNNVLILCILFNTCTTLLPDQSTQRMFQAAREGKRDVIKEYLDNKANCAIKDAKGNNLLHIAGAHGHAEIIEDLTEYRGWWQYYISGPTLPNINEQNDSGYTPLESSINSEQYDAMIVILEAKKEKQKTEQEQLEALIVATRKDDPSSIYLLEHYGYNLQLQNSNGTILHYGIQHKKKKIVGYCARRTALINVKNNNHKAPIVLSVEKNDEEEVDFLAYAGANVNISGENGMRPLHYAKIPLMVDCLVRNKAAIDAQDNHGHTPLHHNIMRGNREMVAHFTDVHLSDVKKPNFEGKRAFAIAMDAGDPTIVQQIAQHPESDINEQDINGQTRYINAVINKDLAKMNELISYKVDRTICDKWQENALHKAGKNGFLDGARLAIIDTPALLTVANKDGDLPLFTAIQHKQTAIAQLYSAHNIAPLHVQNNNGDTVLHEAARTKNTVLLTEYLTKNAPLLRNKQNKLFYHYSAELGDLETIKEMKRLNIPLNEAAPGKKSMLYIVLENNHMHCAPELMYSYMINYKDSDGIAPLDLAARHGNIKIIKDLLRHDADINTKDNNQSTAMHYAARYNQPDAMKVLKANGLSPLIGDANGNTPTHIAAQHGNLAAIDYCIEYNWQTLSVPNNDNETPFITAARHGKTEIAKRLLNDKHLIDNDIDRAITIAHKHGQHATARMLENAKQQHIDECKKEVQTMRQIKDLITKNKDFKNIINQKRPRDHTSYSPSTIEEITWEQLSRMPIEKRTAISVRNSQALMQESTKHNELTQKICAIEQEESRLKLEQVTAEAKAATLKLEAEKKQLAEQHALETERLRKAAELDRQKKEQDLQRLRVAQHKRQAEQKEKDQAQVLQNNPVAVPVQNNAPANDAAEEKVENDAHNVALSMECCVCLEEKPLTAVPCGSPIPHSALICKECVAGVRADNNICPICRRPLMSEEEVLRKEKEKEKEEEEKNNKNKKELRIKNQE